MGGEKGRDQREGPQHKVTIGYRLAVGKYPVTFAQWNIGAQNGGCPPRGYEDGTDKDERRAVVNVNREECQQYVIWLRKVTGNPYRLLTEAEWEYAARAGTTSAYSTSNFIGDYAWYSHNAHTFFRTYDGQLVESRGSRPVGLKEPNPFGLYDMHGNVMEWVEDRCNYNYNGAPVDGSAWLTGENTKRVLRGGSWYDTEESLRSAFRYNDEPWEWDNRYGFRVAMTMA